MTPPPTLRQRKKEARPGEIIAAALMLFHTRGFSACKIEDVALAAGVTKGTVYLYFASKEDLFKATIRETVLTGLDQIDEATRPERKASIRLRTALKIWASLMDNCPGSLPKLMIAEAGNFPDLAGFFQEEVSGRIRRMLTGIIESGIKQGEFRNCDSSTVARALSAPVILGNIWRHTFPEQSAELSDSGTLIDALLDVVLNGIVSPTEIDK